MPKWVPKEAKKYFDEVCKLLDSLTPSQLSKADVFGIGTLAVALWRQEQILALGVEVVTDASIGRQLKAINDDIKYWVTKFYLEPTARSKSKVPREENETKNGFQQLLENSGFKVTG